MPHPASRPHLNFLYPFFEAEKFGLGYFLRQFTFNQFPFSSFPVLISLKLPLFIPSPIRFGEFFDTGLARLFRFLARGDSFGQVRPIFTARAEISSRKPLL